MTAVAPWGENAEDAYDQGLVELGLGDSRLIEMKGSRDSEAVNEALSVLRRCCRDSSNIMPPIISAVKAEATVGEVNSVLREELGTWFAPSGV